jgi:hypothetical protein
MPITSTTPSANRAPKPIRVLRDTLPLFVVPPKCRRAARALQK